MTRDSAFLFDGQGSFVPGFGKDLMRFPVFAETFRSIAELTGNNLGEWAWGKTAVQTAKRNSRLQPTLFALNLGLAQLLSDQRSLSDLKVAGHSLGELCAMAFSGILSLPQAARLVRLRGELMEEAGGLVPQDMLAIRSGDWMGIEGRIKERYSGRIFLSNHNAQQEIVVAGENAALKALALELQRESQTASRLLGTGIACHSPLLNSAQVVLNQAIDGLEIHPPRLDFFSVGCDRLVKDPGEIRESLKVHMTAPVYWARAMQSLSASGVRRAIEIGPSKILKGLALKSASPFEVRTSLEVISELASH